MKSLLLLLSVLLTLPALSQPGKPPKKVILFENHAEYLIFRIAEGQKLSLTLKSGMAVTGKISEIRGDTIVIGESTLLAADIAEIRKTVSGSPPFGPTMNSSAGWYRADTSAWKIVCPPPEAYTSRISYHSYLTGQQRNLKKEKNETYSPFLYKNFLKINLFKLAHLEVAFSYERVIAPKWSWETEISCIFGLQDANAYYQFNYPLYNYNGFSVTTNPKYYIISPRVYVGMVFIYRYLWFNQVRTGWPDKVDNGNLQDQYRNDYGISLRIGMMRRYGPFVADWYVGGGIKVIRLHQLVYAHYLYHDSNTMHWRHEDHSPDVYDRNLLEPVINAGIKIGFGF